jgi:hypothetical protein
MSGGRVTDGGAPSGNGGEKGDNAVSGGGVPIPAPWSRIYDRLQETLHRVEPDLRPECGRIVLARTDGMAKREHEYYGSTLFIKLVSEVCVTPEVLVVCIVLARREGLTVHRCLLPIKFEGRNRPTLSPLLSVWMARSPR